MVAERIGEMPFSCSTNLSNDVIEHLGMLGPGPLALRFLTRMHRRTFGDAGDHRKNNESFLSCTFDLAGWAAALGCNRSNLLKTRAHLEESHIFTFEPGEPGSGRGKLTWNINFEEWVYYHRRVAKRQQATLVQFHVVKTQLNTLDSAPSYSETELSTVGKDNVTELRQPAVAICNRTKDGCFEGAAGQAPDAPKKEYVKKEITKEEETYIAPQTAQGKLLSTPEVSPAPKKERKRDDLWDAAVQVFGFSPEGSAAGLWGKKLKLMRTRSVPVTPEELPVLAAAYQRKYPDATFSLAAIEAHVDDLRIFIKTGGTPHGSHAGTNKRETYQPKAAAGADGTGAGRDNGDEWAGWNHHKYTVTSTGVAVDQDGNTW